MRINKTGLSSYDDAFDVVCSNADCFKMDVECCIVPNAVSRILAEDIKALSNFPMADNSAMDGYCFRHRDISSSKPALQICARIDAGLEAGSLPRGKTAYVATGAVIPRGGDTVVKMENVVLSKSGEEITILQVPPPGSYIRKEGQDISSGTKILRRGTLLTPYYAGVLAAAGYSAVKVSRRPRVCLITSGNELVMPFETPMPWQVRNSNSVILSAQIARAGGIPIDLGIVRDDSKIAAAVLERAAELGDIIVTSGGISMGMKDPFASAIDFLPVRKLVQGVSIKPGKPFFFGTFKDKPLFGLPGNQASSAVTFELFVRPFLARIMGNTEPDHPVIRLPLANAISNPTGRDHFCRARIVNLQNKTLIDVLEKQESHMLASLMGFTHLVRHKTGQNVLKKGTSVACMLIDR